MTAPTVTPSQAFTDAIARFQAVIAAQPPEVQTDLDSAMLWLLPAIQVELDNVAATYAAKLPVLGPFIDKFVQAGINDGIAQAEREISAAKAAVAATTPAP